MTKSVIITFIALALAAIAQTPLQITPYQALDARSGQVVPCVGCKIYTYAAGTTTQQATYTDASLATVNTNPVFTNSAGYAVNGSTITGIWVGSACYKIVLRDANDVTIWTQDNLCPAALSPATSLAGLDITMNAGSANGGYINFKPVTYNPYDGNPCFDYAGNPVQQPLPAGSLPQFGPNDLLMWNSLSPSMPANGSCGAPLPINQLYGINTNGYFFARAGLATDYTKYNSIQSLLGGITAGSFTAGILYPPGTMTTSGVVPAPGQYLGGHVDVGHSAGPPTCTGGYPCLASDRSIATSPNPLTDGEGLVAGMLYYDDMLQCFNGYTGTAWACIGGGGAGSFAGPNNTLLTANTATNVPTGYTALQYNPITNIMLMAPLGTCNSPCVVGAQGIVAPLFNANNGGTNLEFQGTAASIRGDGHVATNGWLDFGERAAPAAQTGHDVMYADSGTHQLMLSLNNGSFFAVGAGGAPGSPANSIQFNSGGVFTGSGNLLYSGNVVAHQGPANAAGIVEHNGFVQSDLGFLAPPGTATVFNSFQAPGGGMQALSFTAANYVQTGHSAGTPVTTANDQFHAGAMNYNTANSCEQVFNGPPAEGGTSTWACIGGGGGGGTAAGPTSSVQINSGGGSFGGSGNLTFNGSLLNVIGIPNTAGINVQNGFIQSDQGFTVGVNTLFNSIHTQAAGGMSARSFTASGYVQTGNSAGVPTTTASDTFHAGAMYYDTVNTCEEVFNGSSWSCVNSGGSGGGGGVLTFDGRSGNVALLNSDVSIATGQDLGVGTGLVRFANSVVIHQSNTESLFVSQDSHFDGGFITPLGSNSQLVIGTGAYYARVFSGTPSCGGISDGWQGFDLAAGMIYTCDGGNAIPSLPQGLSSSSSPTFSSLTVSTGEVVGLGTSLGQLRAANGNGGGSYGAILRQDGTDFHILLTDAGNALGIWNTLRPFSIHDSTGRVSMSDGLSVLSGLTTDSLNSGSGSISGTLSAATLGATTVNATFVNTNTVTATGSVIGANVQNTNSSFFVNSGGNMNVSSVAVGSGAPFNINAAGVLTTTAVMNTASITSSATVAALTLGAAQLVIGTNNGTRAVSGNGATISNNNNNIAVFTFDTGGACGIGTGEPSPGIACSSDETLKENIMLLKAGALDKVLHLKPKEYDWKTNGAHSVGFVAQDVRDVIPQLVRDQNGKLVLSQDGLIPYLVRAIQEQQAEIELLKERR